MARIAVLGAGVCGLATAMLLARDDHDVTVLERDPARVPESLGEAWERWERGGVAQFRQPHYLQPRDPITSWRPKLPGVRDALVAAGAVRFDTLGPAPALPSATSSAATGGRALRHPHRPPPDDRTGRRPGRGGRAAPRGPAWRRRGGAHRRAVFRLPHVIGVRATSRAMSGAPTWWSTAMRPAVGRCRGGSTTSAAGPRPTEGRGLRLRLLWALFPVEGGQPAAGGRWCPIRVLFDAHVARGQRDLGGAGFSSSARRPRHAGVAGCGPLGGGGARCPPARAWIDAEPITGVSAMAGMRDRYVSSSRTRPGGDRPGRRRRRLGQHQPVARSGRPIGAHACACGMSPRTDRPMRTRFAGGSRGDRRGRCAPYRGTLPSIGTGWPRSRRSAPGENAPGRRPRRPPWPPRSAGPCSTIPKSFGHSWRSAEYNSPASGVRAPGVRRPGSGRGQPPRGGPRGGPDAGRAVAPDRLSARGPPARAPASAARAPRRPPRYDRHTRRGCTVRVKRSASRPATRRGSRAPAPRRAIAAGVTPGRRDDVRVESRDNGRAVRRKGAGGDGGRRRHRPRRRRALRRRGRPRGAG